MLCAYHSFVWFSPHVGPPIYYCQTGSTSSHLRIQYKSLVLLTLTAILFLTSIIVSRLLVSSFFPRYPFPTEPINKIHFSQILILRPHRYRRHGCQNKVNQAREDHDENVIPRIQVQNPLVRDPHTHGLKHTRKQGRQCHKPSDKRTPVESVIVPVYPNAWLEQMRDVDPIPAPHPEVIGHDDSRGRAEEQGVRSQEGQERGCFGLDLPRTDGEADDGAHKLASADVDVPWKESRQIIRKRDRVTGDVGHDVEEDKHQAGEELGAARIEIVDRHQRVPLDFTVENRTGDRHGTPQKFREGDKDR